MSLTSQLKLAKRYTKDKIDNKEVISADLLEEALEILKHLSPTQLEQLKKRRKQYQYSLDRKQKDGKYKTRIAER